MKGFRNVIYSVNYATEKTHKMKKNNIFGLLLDFDNTMAKINYLSLLKKIHWTSSLTTFHQTCDYYRGFRVPRLTEKIESHLSATKTKNITQIDKCITDLYKSSNVDQNIQKVINFWDEKKWPKGIVSDHPAMAKLSLFNIAGWSTVISCRSYNAFKPLPDGLWAASAALGLPPSKIIFIGDRHDTDAQAAAAFGCHFIQVQDLARCNDPVQRIKLYLNL